MYIIDKQYRQHRTSWVSAGRAYRLQDKQGRLKNKQDRSQNELRSCRTSRILFKD